MVVLVVLVVPVVVRDVGDWSSSHVSRKDESSSL